MNKRFFLIFIFLVATAGLAFAQAAPDPIRLATGARTLGMGKAFVGLSDDISAIFLNPAGLANPDTWQITSMSGKFLDEYNYLCVSGLYPTQFGNLALAYVRSDIGGAFPTTVEAGSDPLDPIYVIDPTQDPMSYYNNLIMLSYSKNLEQVFSLPYLAVLGKDFPKLKEINLGANLKLFAVNLTGDHITEGNASGTELDLGIQGSPLSWLTLGGSIQNALTFGMGGKLHYESGWDEAYPALLKLGAAVKVLGDEQALWRLSNHEVTILVDLDREINRAFMPALYHLGVEWQPMGLIAIRAGIDQDLIGINDVANNFTSGVGVYYGSFRFDYAYHQFAGAPGIDNHFFSLSYGIAPAAAKQDRLRSNPDKLVTTASLITVEGAAVDPEIVRVRINGVKVDLSPRGDFKTTASLKIGKNSILVQGFNSKSRLVDADKLRVLRLFSYPDVPEGSFAAKKIGYVASLDLIKGYPDSSFKPDGNITRAELSALLVRTKLGSDENIPRPSTQQFQDLPLSSWAASYVSLAVAEGIVTGYPNGTFGPAKNVTRAEGLSMIARFGGIVNRLYNEEYRDIGPKHWAAPIIAGAYKEGLLSFIEKKFFEPDKLLTRAEAIEMLSQTKPVTILINNLLDFEKGY